MKPEVLNRCDSKVEGKKYLAGLLNAVDGIPLRQRPVLMSRILKEIVAGKISSAEASEIARAMKR